MNNPRCPICFEFTFPSGERVDVIAVIDKDTKDVISLMFTKLDGEVLDVTYDKDVFDNLEIAALEQFNKKDDTVEDVVSYMENWDCPGRFGWD